MRFVFLNDGSFKSSRSLGVWFDIGNILGVRGVPLTGTVLVVKKLTESRACRRGRLDGVRDCESKGLSV